MTIKDLITWKRNDENMDFNSSIDNAINSLQHEMNRMFNSFPSSIFEISPFSRRVGSSKTITPRVDVAETGNEIQVTAELPGMEEKDIEVNFSKDMLVIRGEKKSEKEDKNKGYYLVERTYGSFHRAIPIPVEVDPEKVEAKFKNGVLRVTLLKTKEAQNEVKKIPVKCE